MLPLLILGLLCEGDRHPYDVVQIIKDRNMHNYIKINFGSLYYNFEQLLKKGDIAVKEVITEEKRPDKTIYTITAQGRERFDVMLRETFYADVPYYHPLYPAILFTMFSTAELIRDAMEQRRAKLVRTITELEALIAHFDGRIHWANVQIIRNGLIHTRAELEWVDGFLRELAEKGTGSPGLCIKNTPDAP